VQQLEGIERPKSPKFDQAIWEKVTRKYKNWKECLTRLLTESFPKHEGPFGCNHLEGDEAPWEPWLVEGQTILIPKEKCQGFPQQYCLKNAMYKLLTAGMTEILHKHAKKWRPSPTNKELWCEKRGDTY